MFTIGQTVTPTQFYLDKYFGWNPGSGQVVRVMDSKKVFDRELSEIDKAHYVATFGKQESYTLCAALVQFGEQVCLVSNLGVK